MEIRDIMTSFANTLSTIVQLETILLFLIEVIDIEKVKWKLY